ncbi:MAG: hypothetical protein HYR64_03875 [Fimbriimonas ginsengisoli]|uniref:DUF4352 domain-containing protein n=1 Tax=Fimbriimonas ginsengisoli TaxID=1005039 RepID=A0A931LU76_FIMGI|nr:hypothetical protein [Fimbriimonas ginsengisoli]
MKRRWTVLLASAPVALFLGLGSLALLARPEYVPPGSRMHVDDFAAYALKSRSVAKVGGVAAPAGKAFYLIDLRFTNEAKRVSFDYRPEFVEVADDQGCGLRLAPEARASLGPAEAHLDAGESAKRTLVFLGPADAKSLKMAFVLGGGAGAAIDAVLFGNRQTVLEVER